MLLELRQLSESLIRANVAVGQQDDHLVTYSKGKPLFRVTLDKESQVRTISLIAKERVGILLKYEVSKGGARESAPGFNVPPLLIPTGTDQQKETTDCEIKQLAKRLKRPPRDDSREAQSATLNAIIRNCCPGWVGKAEAIGKCLGNAIDVLMQALTKSAGSDQAAVAPLLELLRRGRVLTPDTLHERLIETICRHMNDGTADTDRENLLQMLFTKESVVLLELGEWDGVPANHESVWHTVNHILIAQRTSSIALSSGDVGNNTTFDAFGDPNQPTEEKMPERKLPRLGNVKIRSNSASKPCQSRYGLVEAESFAVGIEGRAKLANSIAWLTDAEREGQTYRDISNSCGFDLPALLLAYPNPLPARPPALAAVLAKTGQQGPTAPDVRFVEAAAQVVRELDDLRAVTPAAKVTIFVLAKRDTARTKLLLSRQFTAERITQAVRDWQQAAANIPPIFVRQFGEDKKPRWFSCDATPYPSEVARYLNRVWQRSGERSESVAVFDFGSTLSLLLDEGRLPSEIATRGLRLAVTQWVDLLLTMGQESTLGRVCPFSTNEQLILPSILGLLLFKLSHPKEVYMNAMPYWLGRLMAVADKLHRNYCERERNGQIPKGPLIGNAAMSACLENPQAGLARLSERITLYQQVAGVDLSTELAEIIRHIDACKLPNRATDEHKAQMLLGYLARPDLLKRETPTPTESQS
jgi:hypothetical protein